MAMKDRRFRHTLEMAISSAVAGGRKPTAEPRDTHQKVTQEISVRGVDFLLGCFLMSGSRNQGRGEKLQ